MFLPEQVITLKERNKVPLTTSDLLPLDSTFLYTFPFQGPSYAYASTNYHPQQP